MSSSDGPDGAGTPHRAGEVLERRYRRLLAVLPKAYRAAREEELLAVLMDKSGPRQQWPTAGEASSLAWLGMRARIGVVREVGSPAGRAEVIRIVALLSVLYLAMQGVVQAVLIARFNIHFGLGDSPLRQSWLRVSATYAEVGWLFAYVALVTGRWRTGRAVCVVLCAITAISDRKSVV